LAPEVGEGRDRLPRTSEVAPRSRLTLAVRTPVSASGSGNSAGGPWCTQVTTVGKNPPIPHPTGSILVPAVVQQAGRDSTRRMKHDGPMAPLRMPPRTPTLEPARRR